MFEREMIELVRSTRDMLTEEKELEITAKGRAQFCHPDGCCRTGIYAYETP